MAFIGNTNQTQAFTPATDYFSGNGSTTAFTLSRPVASVNQVLAVVNNVDQDPASAYTVSGNTITFTSAPSSGTNNIYVRYTSPITQVLAPSQNTVYPSSLSVTNALYWDASANVGIGTTSPYRQFQVGNYSTNATMALGSISSGYSTICFATADSAPGRYIGLIEYGHSANYMGFTTNGSERARIDSSGNVGIATTSTSGANLVIATNSNGGSGIRMIGKSANGGSEIDFYNNANSALNGFVEFSDTQGVVSAVTSIPLTFRTGNTERMRIDSNGTNLIGCTGGGASGNMQVLYGGGSDIQKVFSTQASSGSYSLVSMFSNATTPSSPSGTLRVNILTNGGIQNYQANNSNLSDERTKTDINLAGSYLNKICAIPVKTFKYKDQTDNELNLGVIAQDVEAVAPELVDVNGFGEVPEDGVPLKAIYQTDLQYALMKCIQEQQEIINDLKARIETLEAK